MLILSFSLQHLWNISLAVFFKDTMKQFKSSTNLAHFWSILDPQIMAGVKNNIESH
jgi:ABC-type polysaccharide/polyol phosphate export permease